MVLVVAGHFLQIIEWKTMGAIQLALRTIIIFTYIFHMPLFVGISGYLSGNLDKRRDLAFRDLLVPYFVFQIIFSLLYANPRNIFGVAQNIFIPQFGLWYLLALFIWRMLAKDLAHIRFIIPAAIILNVFTYCFSGLGKELAIQRVVGFLVYFIIGLLIRLKEKRIPSISKNLALILLVLEVVGIFSLISQFGDKYQLILNILCHRVGVSSFSKWYTAPVIYAAALILACLNSVLFVNVTPDRSGILERVGCDTLSVYISHLVLYIVITRLTIPDIFTCIISLTAIIVSLILFTCTRYRYLFNCFIAYVNGSVS